MRPAIRGLYACAALALAALVVAVGCATNPVTGKKELSFVSEAQELEVGKQSAQATEMQTGYYTEGPWPARFDTMGAVMSARSHRPGLEWNFFVLDDPTVNAFAAPGGYIYVTRGILAHLGSEAQLAGVLGHEIGHVTARHYSRQASREQLAGIGLAVGSIFSEAVARYGQLAQQGLGVLFLKYSRDQESESDRLGIEYSIKAGYDPREMPVTYRTLARISERAGQRIPTYLSTHPDPAAREGTTRELAAQAVGARTDLRVNKDAYIRSLDGMVYGNDPRQGYFEGDRLYHPQMAFTLDLPAGWERQNTHTAILAAREAANAVLQVTVAGKAEGKAPAQMVEDLAQSGAITGSRGQNETVGGMDAWVGRVGVKDNQGQEGVLAAAWVRKDAKTMLRFLGQVTPGSAEEEAFLATVRSLRTLTDPGRLQATPARIDIVKAPKAGTFAGVMAGLGPQAIEVEEAAILNGVEAGDPIAAGRLLKVVRPAKLK